MGFNWMVRVLLSLLVCSGVNDLHWLTGKNIIFCILNGLLGERVCLATKKYFPVFLHLVSANV